MIYTAPLTYTQWQAYVPSAGFCPLKTRVNVAGAGNPPLTGSQLNSDGTVAVYPDAVTCVTTAGNINIVSQGGVTIVLPIAVGQIIPLQCAQILAATTAVGIVVLWV